MEKKQALQIIAQVCAVYRGTLQEHQALQTALQVINEGEAVVVDAPVPADAKDVTPEEKAE